MTYFVEVLTVRVWVGSLLPQWLWARWRHGQAVHRCYVFDSTRWGFSVAKATAWIAGVIPESLQFRLVELKDEEGFLLRFKIPSQDLLQVRTKILREEPLIQELLAETEEAPRLPLYLARAMTSALLFEQRATLWRALQVIQICCWKMKQVDQRDTQAVCVLERRPWFDTIANYASTQGVQVRAVSIAPTFRAGIRRHLSREWIWVLQALRAKRRFRQLQRQMTLETSTPSAVSRALTPRPRPRVAVEYFGHLNLDAPERYSDLFFWQQSSLSASDLLLVFNHPSDPLDGAKQTALAVQGIAAIALQPDATRLPAHPVFVPTTRPPRRLMQMRRCTFASRHFDAQWLQEQLRDYQTLRTFWAEFFEQEGVKLFTSWFRYTQVHCAIADALQSIGGATAIYQRAYESYPSTETTVAADIVFAFSPASAETERRSGSVIPYHVSVGYLGDHRFPLLRDQARRIRDTLQARGARRIVALTDENAASDERWHTGHAFEQENYRFVLEQVLAEPWLGLVVKPKVPASLRRRLGLVAELLARAEATGRCYVFQEGQMTGAYPPAAAGLAADVMIHGHLNAGTAGMDAALAGVPTLLLDRLGCPVSPLYRLGVGRSVFRDWQSLWDACREHWTRPGGVPGFGDWSPLLDELDPFRDGRAAWRMGTYLQWLLEGFRAGLDRQTILADAAERYAAAWGTDKVTSINSEPDGFSRSRHVQPIPAEEVPV